MRPIMEGERNRIIAALKGGATQRAVAQEFERSLTTVRRISAKLNGAKTKPTKPTKKPPHRSLTIDERIERLVERAGESARSTGKGHEVVFSVQDFEDKIRESKAELERLEDKRSQMEEGMAVMLSNGSSESEGDEMLSRINALERTIRKTRSSMQGFTLRMGDRKRQDELENTRKMKFIERYGVEGEKTLCEAVDKAIKELSRACHALNDWKTKVDDARYQCTGARARPNHVGYAVSQRLIRSDMNQFLHLGVKNLSFVKSSLFETLHPGAGTRDAVPPLETPQDREAQLARLISEKHAEVDESRAQEEQQTQDEKPVSEMEPLPEGAELSVKNIKKDE